MFILHGEPVAGVFHVKQNEAPADRTATASKVFPSLSLCGPEAIAGSPAPAAAHEPIDYTRAPIAPLNLYRL